MTEFADIIDRADAGSLIPEPVAQEIIQEAPKQSVALTRMRRATMSSKTLKQPVLSGLPAAYWLNSDTALKQTTEAQWGNVIMTAEELAALVIIPDAVVDDANVPLWDQVKPLLAEAAGKLIDEAALFGVNKPTSWPTAVIPGAIAAGNTVTEGANADLAADVAALGGMVAADGFAINGFASAPGLNWRLVGLRDSTGRPVYAPALTEGTPSNLYGYPLNEVMNGAWDSDVAALLGADWSKFVVGVRQDLTYKIFDQMVINDAAGKVIFNAAQQDSKVMRIVMRVGFQVANPMTRVNGTAASRYPAGVLVPAETP